MTKHPLDRKERLAGKARDRNQRLLAIKRQKYEEQKTPSKSWAEAQQAKASALRKREWLKLQEANEELELFKNGV